MQPLQFWIRYVSRHCLVEVSDLCHVPLSFELKVSVVDDHDTPKTAEAEIFGGSTFEIAPQLCTNGASSSESPGDGELRRTRARDKAQASRKA